jgi:hypothetical protein
MSHPNPIIMGIPMGMQKLAELRKMPYWIKSAIISKVPPPIRRIPVIRLLLKKCSNKDNINNNAPKTQMTYEIALLPTIIPVKTKLISPRIVMKLIPRYDD